MQAAERRHRPLLGDEEGRVDLGCGIVHGDDQVPRLAGDPLMARAVLVQHHADHRPPQPLAPVGAATWRRTDPPVRLQGDPQPVVAAPESVLGDQRLVQVLDPEIPVAGVEQLQHRHHLVYRRPTRRNPPEPAVIEPLRPVDLVARPPAPEVALRHPENLRRLGLAEHATPQPSVNLLELHLP
jgi:hypothetical protein